MSLRDEPNGKGFLLIMYDELNILNSSKTDPSDQYSAAVNIIEAAKQLIETSKQSQIPLRTTTSGLTPNEIFVKIQNSLDLDWRNDLMELQKILSQKYFK